MPEASTESSFYPGLDTSHDLKQDQGPANVSDRNGTQNSGQVSPRLTTWMLQGLELSQQIWGQMLAGNGFTTSGTRVNQKNKWSDVIIWLTIPGKVWNSSSLFFWNEGDLGFGWFSQVCGTGTFWERLSTRGKWYFLRCLFSIWHLTPLKPWKSEGIWNLKENRKVLTLPLRS